MHRLIGLTLAQVLFFSSLQIVVPTVAATEIVVQNDTAPPGSPMISDGPEPGPAFPGLRLGALLTMPMDGTIVGVKILWASVPGGAPPSQEVAITISSDALVQDPGPALARIESPTLIDGGANEFRYLDPETNLLPLAVPVTAGQTVMIDLEYSTGLGEGAGAAGILADGSNTAGRNAFIIPGFSTFWGDLNLVDLRGDLAVRAIVQPVPEPSAFALLIAGAAALVAVRTVGRIRTRPAFSSLNC